MPQQASAPTLPSSSPYPIRTRDYAQSAGGVHLVVNDLTARVDGTKAHRLYEGGDLSGVVPPYVSHELDYCYDGNDYIIEDENAKEKHGDALYDHFEGLASFSIFATYP